MTRQPKLIAGVLLVLLNSCAIYDSSLAPDEPRYYTVRKDSVFLSEIGHDLYVERITEAGVTVSWRNGQDPWTLPPNGFKSLGNGTYLEAKEIDVTAGTAVIVYTTADRRGFSGAWRF